MIVNIDPDLRIRSEEPANWTIERRHTVKAGKTAGEERWKPLGYHGSIECAVRYLLLSRLHLLDKHTELDVRDVAAAIQDAADRLATVTAGAMVAELKRAHQRLAELDPEWQ